MSALKPDSAAPRRRPRDRRQQILTQARDLFVKSGYRNVSMSTIADEVGITAGALYRHFKTKSDLLACVFEECFEWTETEPLVNGEYSAVVAQAIQIFADRPYVADLWSHERRHLSDESVVELWRRMERWAEPLRDAVAIRRPDLTPSEIILILRAAQAVIACLGRSRIHVPSAAQIPVVQSALERVCDTQLEPPGKRAPRPTGRLPVSLRERLLLAAADLFSRGNGYHETSMADMGAAAGVTGPSMYAYFESKVDVLRAVFERGLHSLWLSLDQALASGQDAEEALSMAVSSFVRVIRTSALTLDDPDVHVHANAHNAQREYLAELVALMIEAKPGIDPTDARLLVQIGLVVAADLHRDNRLSADANFQENASYLVLSILDVPRTSPNAALV